MLSSSSVLVREFIKKIRTAKTQAEERAEVQKQMAVIRQFFQVFLSHQKNDQKYQLRNMTKLLFINMMGSDTDFGQMQCLSLISSNSFTQKRIGYLGLTQLFYQKSDLLMMATNTFRTDLTCSVKIINQNPHVIALSLSVLSEICTNQMSRELASQVIKLCTNSNSYLRKKALMASTRIIKKSQQHINEYIQKIESLIEDRHNGVLIGVYTMIQVIIQLDQNTIKKFIPLLPKMVTLYHQCKTLKTSLSISSKEYQPGVSDPFLQAQILKIFRIIVKNQPKHSKQLAQVMMTVNDTLGFSKSSSNKNCVNAVLFQLAKTILHIDSSSFLRHTAVQLMGKFLTTKDANSKYLALYILTAMSRYDITLIQKHRGIILECLQENDLIIKCKAVELIFIIANQENIVQMTKQLINHLLSCTDQDFIPELTTKICQIVDNHAPNRRWHFDTILKVLIIAGEYVKQQSTYSLINLICSTEELYKYGVWKLFYCSCQYPENQGLSFVTLYLVGQLAHLLLEGLKNLTVKSEHIINLVENIIQRSSSSPQIKQYGMTCLFKLYNKFQEKERIFQIIYNFQTSNDYEVQKRACQYIKLLKQSWNEHRQQICAPIPVFSKQKQINNQIGATNIREEDFQSIKLPSKQQKKMKSKFQKDKEIQRQKDILLQKQIETQKRIQQQIQQNNNKARQLKKRNQPQPQITKINSQPNLIDIDDEDVQIPKQVSKNAQVKSNDNNPIDIFQMEIQKPNQPIPKSNPLVNKNDPFDFFQLQGKAPQTNLINNPNWNEGIPNPFKAFQDTNISITFYCSKQNLQTTKVDCKFQNMTKMLISNFIMQVAVLKHLKLQMRPMNPISIMPSQSTSFEFRVKNNTNAGIGCKIRVLYELNGGKVQQQKSITKFPNGF